LGLFAKRRGKVAESYDLLTMEKRQEEEDVQKKIVKIDMYVRTFC
jgi:hypothetical protein